MDYAQDEMFVPTQIAVRWNRVAPTVRAELISVGCRSTVFEIEIPSTALRAGSSLRLKNSSAQDDTSALCCG